MHKVFTQSFKYKISYLLHTDRCCLRSCREMTDVFDVYTCRGLLWSMRGSTKPSRARVHGSSLEKAYTQVPSMNIGGTLSHSLVNKIKKHGYTISNRPENHLNDCNNSNLGSWSLPLYVSAASAQRMAK